MAPVHLPLLRYPPDRNSPAPLLKPSPAVLTQVPPPKPPADSSLHVLPRRFLGPIPKKVLNSSHVQEKRRHFHDLRRSAVSKVRYEFIGRNDSLSGLEEDDADEGITRRSALKIHVPGLAGTGGREGDLDPESDHESETYGPQIKVGNEVWFGESFDIGREFVSEGVGTDEPSFHAARGRQAAGSSESRNQNRRKYSQHERHSVLRRPLNATRSTEETFFTARSRDSEGEPKSLSCSPTSVSD